MNITASLNRKYVNPTIVMLTSVCINNPVPIQAYLLHSELLEEDFQKMRDALSVYPITLTFLTVDRSLFSEDLPHNVLWSLETYYRLCLTELLPEDVDRILYLDVDMIVHKSLEELYNMDFGGKDVLAAYDSNGLQLTEQSSKKLQEMMGEEFRKGYRYFNAGIMLLNMEQMRDKYTLQTYLDVAKKWNYEMTAPDQDLLNDVHCHSVGYFPWDPYDIFAKLAHDFGISLEDMDAQAAVIHFAGAKPWNCRSYHYDIEELWWHYARQTPIYVELLEDFQQSAMFDTTMEERMAALTDCNNKLMEQNSQLMDSIRKLNERTSKLLGQA